MTSPSQKILRCKDVQKRLGLSRSCIYDKMSRTSPRYDSNFPRPIQLGPHSVGWIEAEIFAWLTQRIKIRRPDAAIPSPEVDAKKSELHRILGLTGISSNNTQSLK